MEELQNHVYWIGMTNFGLFVYVYTIFAILMGCAIAQQTNETGDAKFFESVFGGLLWWIIAICYLFKNIGSKKE